MEIEILFPFFLHIFLWEMRLIQFHLGDIVSRNSYHNDIIFKIIQIHQDVAVLKGMDYRLYADALLSDLSKVDEFSTQDHDIIERNLKEIPVDRDEYFYLPGKIKIFISIYRYFF